MGENPGTIGSLSIQGEGWGEGEYAAQMLFFLLAAHTRLTKPICRNYIYQWRVNRTRKFRDMPAGRICWAGGQS